MLAEDLFFPPDQAELEVRVTPCWTRHNVHYLHEPGIMGGNGVVRSKFDHTSTTLRRVRQAKRRVFIASNTQRNLPDMDGRINDGWYRFTDANVDRMRGAIEDYFGPSVLHIVTQPDRHTVSGAPEWLHEIDNDPPGEKVTLRGYAPAWRPVIEAALTSRPNTQLAVPQNRRRGHGW